jgi:predicted MFS family arabinose efflux permease
MMVNFLSFMDRITLSILQEPIKAELHLTDSQLGLLSGLAFAAFYATLGIPLARFADRSSRVKLISICVAIWSVMTTVCGLARSFPQLFLARMGVGIGEAGCLAPAHSLLGDYFPRERRALAISLFQCGAVIGSSVGLFMVGALGQHLGWRASLQIAGFIGVPVALLAFLTLREPPRPAGAHQAKEPALQAIGALFRRPALVHLTIAYALSMICSSGLTQWFPSYLVRSFGMSLAQVGAWAGLTSGIGGIAGLLTGGFAATWLARRDPRWEMWIPAIAVGACAPLYVLMAVSPTAGLALVFKGCAYYMAAVSGGVALSSVQSFAEPHRRATAVSLVIFFSSLLGQGVGPVLLGTISDVLRPSFGQESLRYALLLSSAALVWSCIHYLLSARRSREDRVN